ncbi:MAG TPA: GAF domain-containing protein [Methylomirabilota bacterium]|nr:GAF domain-containing protein [Methylomirabilota bacterium]
MSEKADPEASKPSDVERRLARLELLYHVSNVVHSTLEPTEAFELMLREARRLLHASSGSIVLLNPTTGFLEIEASHGLSEEGQRLKLRLGEGITGWVAKHGKPARVGDVQQDPRYVPARDNVRSELAVPLEVNGELRGAINVDSEEPNAFSADDEQLLRDLAQLAATVVRNTWLYDQVRHKAKLLEALVSVSQSISSALNLDEALQAITREACGLMGGKMASVLLLDKTQEHLILRASHGAGEVYIAKPDLLVADSLVGTVVRRKKPIQVQNVQISSRYQSVEIARQEGLVSLLSVPLMFREQPLGALCVYTGEMHSFSNEEVRILSALAELSGIAIEKARLHDQILHVEEQLRQSEKLSAVGLLAAEIAHEIRNPLTVMKMLYHSLNLRFAESDPRARDARMIAEKMDHLNKIVDQALALARNADPDFRDVQVVQLLEELGLLLRHKLRQQSISLTVDFEMDLPLVRADAGQLSQAFLNVALNAIEAMPEGGALTLRTFRKVVEGDWVVVEIQDSGHGMSAEQRERVFSSLLSTTKKSGTGLGLAIVQRIAETHRGRLEVRSEQSKGTTIGIILPALSPEESK